MSTRIIQDIEPSSPWMWMALISSSGDLSSILDFGGSGSSLAASASWAASALAALKGGKDSLSAYLTEDPANDKLIASLAQSVILPPWGYTVKYEDLGFVKYPTPEAVISDPITLDFVETADAVISRYFLKWLNGICKVSGNLKNKFTDLAPASLFAPLAKSSKSLYIIKTKRSVLTGILNSVVDYANKASGLSLVSYIKSGLYELPIQVYCFPKVVPQKVIEAKLDKSEGNSLRNVQVIFERVPTLIMDKSKDSLAASELQVALDATLTFSRAADAAAEALVGTLNTAYQAASQAAFVSKIYTRETAEELTSKSTRPSA